MRPIGNKQTNTRKPKNSRKIPDMKHPNVDKHNSGKKLRMQENFVNLSYCDHEAFSRIPFGEEDLRIHSGGFLTQLCNDQRVISYVSWMRAGHEWPMYNKHQESLPLERIPNLGEKVKNITGNAINCATKGLERFNDYAPSIGCRAVNVSKGVETYDENFVVPSSKKMIELFSKPCFEHTEVYHRLNLVTSDCRPEPRTESGNNRNLIAGASAGIAVVGAIMFFGVTALACGVVAKKCKKTTNPEIEKSKEDIQSDDKGYFRL